MSVGLDFSHPEYRQPELELKKEEEAARRLARLNEIISEICQRHSSDVGPYIVEQDLKLMSLSGFVGEAQARLSPYFKAARAMATCGLWVSKNCS